MEIIQSDSALAFEMVSLLSRELNATQNKIRGSTEEITGRGLDLFLTDLLVIQHFLFQKLVCHKTDTERAEAAEIAVKDSAPNIEKIGKVSTELREEMNQTQRSNRLGPGLVKVCLISYQQSLHSE